MNTQTYPTDLTDRQWDCIKDLIPAAKAGGRPRSLDMRHVINAMLYIVVSGSQWRMLPKEYPKWQSVYHYFRIWGAMMAPGSAFTIQCGPRFAAGLVATSIQPPVAWIAKCQDHSGARRAWV